MNPDMILITDLGLDALNYMERAVNALSDDLQMKVMAGVVAGGQMEVRVRMVAHKTPRMSLVLVGDRGELELHAVGGQ